MDDEETGTFKGKNDQFHLYLRIFIYYPVHLIMFVHEKKQHHPNRRTNNWMLLILWQILNSVAGANSETVVKVWIEYL